MNKNKEILIGMAVGIICTVIGTLLYVLLFSDLSLEETYKAAKESGYLGGLLTLGAIPNLLAFFGFLKIKRDHRAQGVLIATLLVAIVVMIYKFF